MARLWPISAKIHQRHAKAAAVYAEGSTTGCDAQIAPESQLQTASHRVTLDGVSTAWEA
jgi:hypothetical protein